MKRFFALIITVVMITALAGCFAAPQEETLAPTEPQPQAHTLASPDAQEEAEWSAVDRVIALESDDVLYAEGSDIQCFALTGDSSGAELRFRFTDEAAAMLLIQDAGVSYYLTMDGEKIGDAKLNDDCTEATLVGDYSFSELCVLANRIRGFEE